MERSSGRSLRKLPVDEEGATEKRLREHLKAVHENTIGKFLSFENIGDFARKCMDILVYIFNGSTARLHPLFHPFAESFIASLDILPRSLMKDIAFTERSSYFIFFRKYIMNGHTPFIGTPLKGLQVLGFLETRNIKFDKVFVLDANEDILPDTGKEETLLPFKVREILGLPTYRDRDKLTAYYFDSLLKRSKGGPSLFHQKRHGRALTVCGETPVGKAEKRQGNQFDPLRQTYPIPGETHKQSPRPDLKNLRDGRLPQRLSLQRHCS